MKGALEELQEVLPVAGEILEADERDAHIVLVDDDPQIRKLCDWYLKSASPLGPKGIETQVHCVVSGEEAIDLARRIAGDGERIACALVDIVLGSGRDGIDTILALWELDPDIECTLVTGCGEKVEQQIEGRLPDKFLDRWDYMAKPFSQFEIVQRARRALSSWVAHRREERRSGENLKLLRKLARINRELEGTVQERTRALAARNDEQEKKNRALEQALRELEAAQGKLLQQEKLASIGQLAAGVAHELNNPIGFVHSNLGTLERYYGKIRRLIDAYEERVGEDPELDAFKRELKLDFVLEDLPALIEESREGTERVRKIVCDLKVFSHPDEHKAGYHDLNEGLRSTLNIVHNEIKYKAQVHTEYGDIPAVRCFSGQINQVLMNLLVNAAQAIEEKGEIWLSTRLEGDEAVLQVKDSGCGIPPDVASRIFDPFFTTKEVGEGTGLGLSISYDIVRKHGGTLSVDSEVGQGTTFTIRLPVNGGGELSAE